MRIGKERCERKAYPHRVYRDGNRIRLHVNEALGLWHVRKHTSITGEAEKSQIQIFNGKRRIHQWKCTIFDCSSLIKKWEKQTSNLAFHQVKLPIYRHSFLIWNEDQYVRIILSDLHTCFNFWWQWIFPAVQNFFKIWPETSIYPIICAT